MTEPIAELEAALEASSDADDALRATVRLLAAQPGIEWAGIAFVETTGLVVGPSAGAPDEALMVTATQTIVLVDLASRRPTPLPEASRVPIRAFEGTDLEE